MKLVFPARFVEARLIEFLPREFEQSTWLSRDQPQARSRQQCAHVGSGSGSRTQGIDKLRHEFAELLDRPFRDAVHVLNLRYAGTVEDEVYAALSHRFGDIFAVLGQLPDAFEDDWIDAVLKDRSAVRHFSQRIDTTKPPMELRYLRDVADDHGLDWEYTEKVLSSRDIDDWMRKGW